MNIQTKAAIALVAGFVVSLAVAKIVSKRSSKKSYADLKTKTWNDIEASKAYIDSTNEEKQEMYDYFWNLLP